MKKNIQSELIDQMAYGSISKTDVPGDIYDYDAVLVKEVVRVNKQEITNFKLKFKPKKKTPNGQTFFVNIDIVRKPAQSLYILKYQENQDAKEGKEVSVKAALDQKITRKMMLSIDKDSKVHEDLQYESSKSSHSDDSDIPKKKTFNRRVMMDDSYEEIELSSGQPGKPRKRRNLGNNDD